MSTKNCYNTFAKRWIYEMNDLSPKAQKLKERYIRKTSPINRLPKKKKRGLQAEINKISSIQMSIRSDEFDIDELMRLKAKVYELYSNLDYYVNGPTNTW